MICPNCYGKGERGSVVWNGVKVCPECQGSGIAYCCDKAGAGAEEVVKYGRAYVSRKKIEALDELARLGQEWDLA